MEAPGNQQYYHFSIRTFLNKLHDSESQIDSYSHHLSDAQPAQLQPTSWFGRAISLYDSATTLLNQQKALLSFEWSLSSYRSEIKDYLKKSTITPSQLNLLQLEVNRVHNKVATLREIISSSASKQKQEHAQTEKVESKELISAQADGQLITTKLSESRITDSIDSNKFYYRGISDYISYLTKQFRTVTGIWVNYYSFNKEYLPHVIKAYFDVERCSELTKKEIYELQVQIATLHLEYYLTEAAKDPNRSQMGINYYGTKTCLEKLANTILSKEEVAKVNDDFKKFATKYNNNSENPHVKSFIQYMTNTMNRGKLDSIVHKEDREAMDKEFEDLFTGEKSGPTQSALEKQPSETEEKKAL